jgi:hypothetical protein
MQTTSQYNPTNEWLKEHLSGWVEKSEEGKPVATIRAHYRVIHSPEHKSIPLHDFYAQTTEKHFRKLSEEAVFYKAIHKDIFKSELTLLTQSLPYEGSLMEIMLHFPNHQSELMFLAWIDRVEPVIEMGRSVYHAHLKSVAVNQRTLTKMIHNLNNRKT